MKGLFIRVWGLGFLFIYHAFHFEGRMMQYPLATCNDGHTVTVLFVA